ncbi:MAG: aldo/keto reductase [Methanosphaera stadtmanae]|nr:aldo/keto reductase [Methanosphaera stadtmanae]
MLNKYYRLSNGVKIPKIGFGTAMMDNLTTQSTVKKAIDLGYRLIDTAYIYENEVGVGNAINSSDIDRKELFVTTKIDPSAKNYLDAKQNLDKSFQNLNSDYIDLLLIHSPQPWNEFRGENHYLKENIAIWKLLEEFYESDLVRAIGVSNFQKIDLDNLIDNCEIKPMVNQVLAHISNTPFDIIDYSRNEEVLVEAYSPLANSKILNNPNLQIMAEEYDVTVAQLCIKYCIELGLLPIVKSEDTEHMKENLDFNFKISHLDMEYLEHIERISSYGDLDYMSIYSKQI